MADDEFYDSGRTDAGDILAANGRSFTLNPPQDDAEDLIVLSLALVKEVMRLIDEQSTTLIYETAYANVVGKAVEDVTPQERALAKNVSFGPRVAVQVQVKVTDEGVSFDTEQVRQLRNLWRNTVPALQDFGVTVDEKKLQKLKEGL
jgi:hypothetical protein